MVGPAECAIWCMVARDVRPDSNTASIGEHVNATLWITDAQDSNILDPISCVGKLLVEGPTLAREHLSDSRKTNATFIKNSR